VTGVQSFMLVAARHVERTTYLLGGERPHLFGRGLRSPDHRGDLAGHNAPLHSLVEGLAQRRMELVHASWGEAGREPVSMEARRWAGVSFLTFNLPMVTSALSTLSKP
jgi:hypothetical protein